MLDTRVVLADSLTIAVNLTVMSTYGLRMADYGLVSLLLKIYQQVVSLALTIIGSLVDTDH